MARNRWLLFGALVFIIALLVSGCQAASEANDTGVESDMASAKANTIRVYESPT